MRVVNMEKQQKDRIIMRLYSAGSLMILFRGREMKKEILYI